MPEPIPEAIRDALRTVSTGQPLTPEAAEALHGRGPRRRGHARTARRHARGHACSAARPPGSWQASCGPCAHGPSRSRHPRAPSIPAAPAGTCAARSTSPRPGAGGGRRRRARGQGRQPRGLVPNNTLNAFAGHRRIASLYAAALDVFERITAADEALAARVATFDSVTEHWQWVEPPKVRRQRQCWKMCTHLPIQPGGVRRHGGSRIVGRRPMGSTGDEESHHCRIRLSTMTRTRNEGTEPWRT